jgi:Holliday junction resolvase-like predicted endonuclease
MTGTKGQDRLDRLEKLAEEMFAGIAQLRQSQAKTDEQLSRTDAQLSRTIKKLDEIGRQLGDLGLVQGEVAEDLFFRNLKGVFRKTNIDLKKVKRNLKRKGEGEFDLVAENGDKVLVVEVKNKLEKRMVDRFLEKKLPRFKELFPEYEKYQVIGGMGALVVKDDVGRYAEKAGLYVLTQTDEGGAALLNREGFKPRTFN